MVEELQVNRAVFYELMEDCASDKDIEKLIKVEKREQYYSKIAGSSDSSETMVIEKIQHLVITVMLSE